MNPSPATTIYHRKFRSRSASNIYLDTDDYTKSGIIDREEPSCRARGCCLKQLRGLINFLKVCIADWVQDTICIFSMMKNKGMFTSKYIIKIDTSLAFALRNENNL